ncbi:MAG: CDP-glycerol glycerophosphotransferase family protein [Fibromonadales bacterium]|nr:CDP-glycerol glycerophosphotransferase family protein [Fibromonadales bacterium]
MNFGNKKGYLDPGTGNALFAALFGIIGSVVFFAKNIFYSLTGKKGEIFKSDLAIFSEGKMYWVYFRDVVEELIKRKIKFTYYTMDMSDPALDLHDFSNKDEDFSVFKVKFVGTGNKGYSAISNLKEKNILSTTPNIGCPGYPVKKPKNCENLIHIFHGLGFDYKKGSMDNYDTILLHQNIFANLFENKKVILAGLPYLDSLIERSAKLQRDTDGKTVLVASTWGDRGLLKTYGHEFILNLANAGYNVIVRPHPYSYIYEKPFIDDLQKKLPNIPFSTEIDNLSVLAKADILISELSGVRLDYYLSFKRPVISLESGVSDEFELNEWLVKTIGDEIGISVKKEEVCNLPAILKGLSERKFIDENSILANIGKSKTVIVDYLSTC